MDLRLILVLLLSITSIYCTENPLCNDTYCINLGCIYTESYVPPVTPTPPSYIIQLVQDNSWVIGLILPIVAVVIILITIYYCRRHGRCLCKKAEDDVEKQKEEALAIKRKMDKLDNRRKTLEIEFASAAQAFKKNYVPTDESDANTILKQLSQLPSVPNTDLSYKGGGGPVIMPINPKIENDVPSVPPIDRY